MGDNKDLRWMVRIIQGQIRAYHRRCKDFGDHPSHYEKRIEELEFLLKRIRTRMAKGHGT